jgi:hypothetical protein
MSLLERLKREFWRPEDSRFLVRKGIGWGRTLNWAALRRRRR